MAQLFHIPSPCQQNTTLVSMREIISGYKKGKYTTAFHCFICRWWLVLRPTACYCMRHISHFFHIKQQIHDTSIMMLSYCDSFHKTIAYTFLLQWQNKTIHSMSGWGKADTFSLVFRKRACLVKAKNMQSVKFRNKELRMGNSVLEEAGT